MEIAFYPQVGLISLKLDNHYYIEHCFMYIFEGAESFIPSYISVFKSVFVFTHIFEVT